MNDLMNASRILRLASLFLGTLILLACSSPPPETPAPLTPSPVATNTAEATEPSETPTIPPTPSTELAILLAPPGADPGQVEDLERTLAELAAAAGMDFQMRANMAPGDLEPNLRILAALPPDPGLQGLVAAAPGTQFLGIGIPGLEPGENLSVISGQGSSPDQLGFVAGYIAALVTPDWRVGALTLGDNTAGMASRQGFLNGVIFFCGLCRPTYPPYLTYPMYVELPSGATPDEWQVAAGTLTGSSVQTIYLAPGAGDETLLASLAQAGVNLIGSASPPPALEDHWVATVSADSDPVLRQIWPDLLAGQGGLEGSPEIEIRDINPDLLTQGRQRLVDELVENLAAGFIDAGGTSAGSTVP
jgi:hypothetical protein